MTGHWLFLLGLFILHLVAVATPGPDFFLVTQVSLTHDSAFKRLAAVVGIATGVLVWVMLTLVGLSQVFQHFPVLHSIVSVLGAAYLLYLAYCLYQACLAQKSELQQSTNKTYFRRGLFVKGFLTNLLNPKAVIYFTSIFSSFSEIFVNPTLKVVAGSMIVLETFSWFFCLSLLFSHPSFRRFYMQYQIHLDKVAAAIFALFAISMLYYEFI